MRQLTRQYASLIKTTSKQLDLDAVKRISIAVVAADLGIRARGLGSTNCPFPDHVDANPSFQIRSKTNGWKCYGCGRWGSSIDLVMGLQGWDFVTAARWLQDKYIGGSSPKRLKPLAQKAQTSRLTEPAATYVYDVPVYNWVLDHSPLQDTGRNYLLGRNISERTLKEFRVGQIGNTKELLSLASGVFGVDRLVSAGLALRSRSGNHVRLVFGADYLLFPFLDGGSCQYLQARAIGDVITGPRWKCLYRLLPLIYNIGALRSSKKVFLCEGVTDVLSAHELGRNAFALLGANAEVPKVCVDLLRERTLHILPDNDRAGRSMGRRLEDQFSRLGIDTVVQKWPIGIKDVNEYLAMVRA